MWKHGTNACYTRGACRCRECTTAHNEYCKEYQKNGRRIVVTEHGTWSGYNGRGCRCGECTKAAREYKKSKHYPIALKTRMANNLRIRIVHAIKKGYKRGSAVRDLGCSIEEFKRHLESMFTEGMSWDNYGYRKECWCIDHIKPLNTFDLNDREQFLAACHYTNMRPLWNVDNWRRPKDGSDVLQASSE